MFVSVLYFPIMRHDAFLGQFLIPELGVYIHLDGEGKKVLFIVFRGVQFHNGSAPRAKGPGVVIPVNAYRVVFVSYPKAVVYLALAVYVLCASRTAPTKVRVELSCRGV